MIHNIAHVCIVTRDIAKTAEFYCGLLGLEKKYEFRKKGRCTGMYLDAGRGTFLEIFERETVPEHDSSIAHFCFQVDDLDLIAEHLEKQGVVTAHKKMGKDGSWQIWIKDPNGISIELQEYTKNSSQITGEDCFLD